MNLTKHAQKRMRQRGFSGLGISIIEQYGRHCQAPGGATKLKFGNKEHQNAISELKHLIQILDHVKGGTIIVKEDNALTLYK